MPEVQLRDITKSFGSVHVIKGVDLDIEQGEFCVFVGPSGCGKSTLLRLVAGLEDITSGELKIRGDVVNDMPPSKRGIAMVFQSYALYPHMTVYNNMAFGMKLAGASKEEIDQKVRKAAGILQLNQLLDRLPKQLSGGQRQRVAIGRAIVREPIVFLFDEPLSNLDAALRTQMRIEIGGLHSALGATMIYVTHDQVEAMTMADKIVVLNAGKVEQVGAPLELYHRPNNLFVATFIGSPRMNLIKTKVADAAGGLARVELPGGGHVGVPMNGAKLGDGDAVVLGVRPEHLKVGDGAEGKISGQVRLAEQLGAETILYVDAPGAEQLIVRSDGLTRQRAGDSVQIGVSPAACHLFSPDGPALVNSEPQ